MRSLSFGTQHARQVLTGKNREGYHYVGLDDDGGGKNQVIDTAKLPGKAEAISDTA